MTLGTDTKWTLLAAGLFFLWALALGVWKYRQIATSPDHTAHVYVDIAHRAALLYAFAILLTAAFVELSGWSAAVNGAAAGILVFFFAGAIVSYMVHGKLRDTDNQFRDPVRGTHAWMVALILGEIVAFAVLLAGFVDAQLL